MSKVTTLKKPMLSKADVLSFAEGSPSASGTPKAGKAVSAKGATSKTSPGPAGGSKSGLVPGGDVRLTANIREDLHLKLKIKAAEQRTTVGELIEQWVENWK